MSVEPDQVAERDEPRPAWQPFSFGGVAAFADASTGRLLVAQLIFSLVAAGCFMAFLALAWVPVIREASHALPEAAAISGAKLQWPGDQPVLLSEGSRLAIVADPGDAATAGRAADLQLELCSTRLRLRSELGYVEWPYSAGWRVSLGRADAVPWWGARQPWFVALAGAALVAKLFAAWWLLAMVVAPVARALAFFGDRTATWPGCMRLAGAAWLPGSLVMSLAILLYGLEALALPGLAFAVVSHGFIGAVYLCGAPFRLAKISTVKSAPAKGVNPFAAPPDGPASPAEPPAPPAAAS